MREHDRFVRIASTLGVALALVSVAPRSHACSVAAAGIRDRAVWPSGDKALPTNGHLLITYGASFDEHIADLGADLVVLDQAGAPVPMTRTRSGAKIVLAPEAALLPAHTYRIADRRRLPCTILDGTCGATNAAVEFATFTTGPAPDTQAPAAGGIVAASPGERRTCDSGSCCGSYETVPIAFTWAEGHDDVAGTDLRYNIYRQSGTTLVPVARFQSRDFFYSGWQTCRGDTSGPDEVTPGAYVVRAVDYAGNEEENAVTRTFADQCGGFIGCAVAAEKPPASALIGPVAAALAFAIAILRGRRRSATLP